MKDERDLLRLSQFLDNELPPEELPEFVDSLLECPELQRRWRRYQLIQEALRLQEYEQRLLRFRQTHIPYTVS